MKMDLLACNYDNLLSNFPPILRRNFKELFCNGRIGLSSVALNDITAIKQYNEDNASYGYFYTVRIPYAGRKLTWEVIFDPEDMTFAPDFNFNDDTFHLSTEIDVVFENVPSLTSWNVENPKSLSLVLKEFVDLYKKQQLEKLAQDNIYAQLNSEYQVLTEEISANDIEVFLDNTNAYFLINIKLDIAGLPDYIQPMNGYSYELLNPGDDICVLKLSYQKLDTSRVASFLQLSPHLDQVLHTRMPNIPNFAKSNSLIDYVNLVGNTLQDQIKKIEENYKFKKEFMMFMCVMQAGNMLEFDSDTFTKGELLCEVDGYFCRVSIELGELFPEEAPIVTLHSLYCVPLRDACCEEVKNYLYSPRWSMENMLEKIMETLAQEIPNFKSHKH